MNASSAVPPYPIVRNDLLMVGGFVGGGRRCAGRRPGTWRHRCRRWSPVGLGPEERGADHRSVGAAHVPGRWLATSAVQLRRMGAFIVEVTATADLPKDLPNGRAGGGELLLRLGRRAWASEVAVSAAGCGLSLEDLDGVGVERDEGVADGAHVQRPSVGVCLVRRAWRAGSGRVRRAMVPAPGPSPAPVAVGLGRRRVRQPGCWRARNAAVAAGVGRGDVCGARGGTARSVRG